MTKRRVQKRRRPKLPISNITAFEPGYSHWQLRHMHPIMLTPIAEHIAASNRKIVNCVACFSKLPFRVSYNGF